LHETWIRHKADVETLKNSLRDLNDKIEEAKRKKNLLVARQRRAEAQRKIQETMSSVSDRSAFESFERMEEKIADMERQALAAVELAGELEGATLERQFAQLEYAGSADQQLVELKQRMGLLPGGAGQADRPQLTGGGGKADVADAEFTEDESKEP
jgi:phage shock protein A